MAPSRLADAAAALTTSLTSIFQVILEAFAKQDARIGSLEAEIYRLAERVNFHLTDFDDLKQSVEADQSEIRSLKDQQQFITSGPTNTEGEPIDIVALAATIKGISALFEKEKASADWGLAWKFGHECTVKLVQDLSILLTLSINEINQALRHAVRILDPQKAEIIFPDRQGGYPVNTGNLGGTHPLNQESLLAFSTSQHNERAGIIDNLLSGPSILSDRPATSILRSSGTSPLSPCACPFTFDKMPAVDNQLDQPVTDWISQARNTGIRIGTSRLHATLPTANTSTRRLTAWDAKIGAAIEGLRNETPAQLFYNRKASIAPGVQIEATKPLIKVAPVEELVYGNAGTNKASGKVATAWDNKIEMSRQALRQFRDTIPARDIGHGKLPKPSIVTNGKENEPTADTHTIAKDSKVPVVKDKEEKYGSILATRQMLETVSSSAVRIAPANDPNPPIFKAEEEKHESKQAARPILETTRSPAINIAPVNDPDPPAIKSEDRNQQSTEAILQTLKTIYSSAVDIQSVNDPKASVTSHDKENWGPTYPQIIANYPKPPITMNGVENDSPTDTETTVSLITPDDLSAHIALEPFPLFNPANTETKFAGTIPIRQCEPPLGDITNTIAWPSSVKGAESAASEGPKPITNQNILAEGSSIDDMKAAMNRFSQQGKYKRGSPTEDHNDVDDFFGTNVRPHTPPTGTRVLGSLLTRSVKREVLKNPFADYSEPLLSNSLPLQSSTNAAEWEDHGLVWQRDTASDGQGFWRLGVKEIPQFHHEDDLLAF